MRVFCSKNRVAPFAGAWIEILPHLDTNCVIDVAPFAGAWIEIDNIENDELILPGRPLRGGVD